MKYRLCNTYGIVKLREGENMEKGNVKAVTRNVAT